MEKLNLVFYLFEQTDPMIDIIYKDLKKKDDYEITFVKDYNQLQEVMSEIEVSLFIFRLIESQDLAQAVGTLQARKQAYKDGTFKAICIQKKPAQRKVERLLRNLGCNEFFDTSVNPRTVRFKIDFLGRGIQSSIKRLAHEENTRNNRNANNDNNNKTREEEQIEVNFIAPLNLESDIWIIKTDEDYRKVLGRWLFRVIGPSTRVGAWEFVESKDATIDGCWRYRIDKEFIGQFIVDEGAWYFRGSKPDFDWKISRWNFSSQKPHLFFKTKEGAIFDRFKIDDKSLLISKNSEFAIIREKEILETCDGRFAINRDHDNNEELSMKSHNDSTQPSHMEGKNSALEDSNNLNGKLKKQDQDHNDPLSGKNKTDEIDGHLGGKLKKENQKEDGPLSGKNKTDEIDGHLGGKLKKESQKEDGPLSGKNKTDEIDGHLGGKLKKEDQKEDGPLSGKNKTDEIDGHLSGKAEKSENEVKENEKNISEDKKLSNELEIQLDKKESKELSIKEEKKEDSELDGKLKKELTYQGDLKGKLAKEQEKTEKDLSQSSNSKVDSHYKGVDTNNKKSNDDNVHSFQTKKESNRLSGNIEPEVEVPVNLESGEIKAFIKINNIKIDSVFEDILAEELFLQVKKGSVKLHSKVEFNLSFAYESKEALLTGFGIVGEVESEDEKDMIIVDLEDVDITKLESFLELYGLRQESISKFLNLAKGA